VAESESEGVDRTSDENSAQADDTALKPIDD
jgi:hypothetical protein